MYRSMALSLLSLMMAVPTPALAQDAQSIMLSMREKQIERWKGVQNYIVDQSIIGHRTQVKFDRVTVTGVEGDIYDIFRMAMPDEDPCNAAQEGSMANMTPEQLEQAADAMEMTGQVMGDQIESDMKKMGVPTILLTGGSATPWASMDPRHMMGAGAEMYRGAATGKRERAAERAMPDTMTSDMATYAEVAELVGTELIDGRDAYHLQGKDLNITQAQEDMRFVIQNVDMWIDASEYVPLRMTMDGTITAENETRPVTLEKLDLDYRQVADSNMYESFRQVMHMSGMLGPEEQAEMREAQKEIAEMEKQLAQMPQAQRDMIMAQMGPQMEMMRGMAAEDGIEMVTQIHNIIVNYCGKPEVETMMAEAASEGGVFSVGGMMNMGAQSAMTSAGQPASSDAGGGTSKAGMIAGAAGMTGTAGIVAATGYELLTDDDDVEVLPYYIDDEGIGVIRYSEPKGRSFQYHMVISGLTANPDRPREVIVGQMGPYAGPDVAIYIGSLNMLGVPLDQVEIELFELEPYQPVVRFRPVVDPDKAEGKDDCGTVATSGACSNTVAR
jgi:hypothetical protein